LDIFFFFFRLSHAQGKFLFAVHRKPPSAQTQQKATKEKEAGEPCKVIRDASLWLDWKALRNALAI
jgi:hypothetical protein